MDSFWSAGNIIYYNAEQPPIIVEAEPNDPEIFGPHSYTQTYIIPGSLPLTDHFVTGLFQEPLKDRKPFLVRMLDKIFGLD